MAIWGEAMTLNHPLWEQQDRDTALDVLAKLPQRGERKITAREERYLDAVFTLYGEGDKPSRDRAHNAMLRASYAVEDPLAPRILMLTDTTELSPYDYAIDRFSTAIGFHYRI